MKLSRIKTKRCAKCEGSGRVLDDKVTAHLLREERLKAKIRLDEMAKALGVSPSYVCCLEGGKRHWTQARVTQYLRITKKGKQ